MNQTINTTPSFQVLSNNQIEKIYHTTLDVLNHIGVRFHNEKALEIFSQQDNEALVTDTNLVKMPPSLVERALKSHPSKINVTGRDGKHTMRLEKDTVNFGTGSDMPFAYDRYTGARRPAAFDDVKKAGLVVDALPNFDFFMSHGIVQNAPYPLTYDRHQFMAMLYYCTKPLIITAVDREGLEDQMKMASVFRDREELATNPMFIVYIEPSSPLNNTESAVDKLIYCAENHIPCMYTPCPSSGATAPASLAGMLVQSLVETLMGSVLSYLVRPGMPLVMGGVITILDMLTACYSYGSPELPLCQAALTDVSKWLNIPMFSTGGCTDAKTMDEQAAVEMTTNLYYAYLSGADLIHDVGYMDSGLTSFLDTLVFCDEVIGMIKQIGKGINTEPEYLALDLIKEKGPGGEFLTSDHTQRHYKEWFQPKLQDRSDYETWEKEGKRVMLDRIVEETDRILGTHIPIPITSDQMKELKTIVESADWKEKNKNNVSERRI